VNGTACEAGATAELLFLGRRQTNAALGGRCFLELIAVETLEVFNSAANLVLSDLGRKITDIRAKPESWSFCIDKSQCWCSALTPLCCDSLIATHQWRTPGPPTFTFVLIFKLTREYIYRRWILIIVIEGHYGLDFTWGVNFTWWFTTEGLSVPHLMCWRTEGTCTNARRCCGVFVILAPDTTLQTYLFTYLLAYYVIGKI